MRAHEAHAEGVAISKGARVFTVFSTSKDHNQGSQAMAGCILIDFEKLQVINRSPAYKNQYVHRRDSVSLQALSEHEIQSRMRLGLVTSSPADDHDKYDDEQWEDIDDESEEENKGAEYRLSTNRRSSVDLSSTVAMESDSKMHLSDTNLNFLGGSGPLDGSGDFADHLSGDRIRSRKPGVSSINEEMEGFSSSDDNMNTTGDDEEDDKHDAL
jgi:hypothetical protein